MATTKTNSVGIIMNSVTGHMGTNQHLMQSVLAITVGKHVYCEKPTTLTTDQAPELYLLAQEANLKNGVVQDKL